MKSVNKIVSNLFLSCSLALSGAAYADSVDADKPLLVIGASYSNGSLPFNDELVAPVFGIAVGFGSYLNLGNALVKDPRLPGYVINEAQGGATTFDRPGCNPGPGCNAGEWQGYEKQLQKAMARVTIPGTAIRMAKYVVITTANDCLHSDAFGIPQDQTTPCSMDEMNAYMDRLLAVGQQAIDAGLVPIFDLLPAYDKLDFPLTAAIFGLNWIADEAYYNTMRDLQYSRLTTELAGAVVLDIWADFEHMGDGTHPNDKTSRKAAEIIAQYIKNN